MTELLSQNVSVKLRTLKEEFTLGCAVDMDSLVAKWREFLKNPEVWRRANMARLDLLKESWKDLRALGLNSPEDSLRRLASAGIIEVRFSTSNHLLWDLPWEFLLRSATQEFRSRDQRLLVWRHLDLASAAHTRPPQPSQLAILKSNPGYISDFYSDVTMQFEQENVIANIGLKPKAELHNLTINQLAEYCAQNNPDVFHLAGLDSLQAAELKGLKDLPEPGIMLPTDDGQVEAIDPDRLATALCPEEEQPPILLVFNFNRSSSMAAKVVSRGAHAAIGFYNDVDDLVAENFLANFYLAWRLADWDILEAFKMASYQLFLDTQLLKLRGFGLTLWTRSSLLDSEKKRRKNEKIQNNPTDPSPSLRTKFEEATSKPAKVTVSSKTVIVWISSFREINYCQLHNNRNLFRQFFIRKTDPEGIIKNVTVEVSLHAGPEPLMFRTQRDMRHSIWVLEDEVRVPLTATLQRVLKESMYTGLHVKVSAADLTVYENTFRVNLLPVGYWQDDVQNRKWLPSFVLPHDPAVAKIIEVAQKYLVAISDDPIAGFIGYPYPENQIRAIWYALAEFNLKYITIPPTYAVRSQRLRSPSETLGGNRGNCIDIALLFAAVLESIGVHPIVFLFDGHAFPGYHTSDESHEEVVEWVLRNATSEEDTWMLGEGFLDVLRESVKNGKIVGVETTGLTSNWSFGEALKRAKEQLTDKAAFEFLVDVRLARDNGVTPLPLVYES
jgi:hypothetical protein